MIDAPFFTAVVVFSCLLQRRRRNGKASFINVKKIFQYKFVFGIQMHIVHTISIDIYDTTKLFRRVLTQNAYTFCVRMGRKGLPRFSFLIYI